MDDERPRRQPVERVYGPLGDHLAARAAGERRITLTFGAIERHDPGAAFAAIGAVAADLPHVVA